MAGEESAVGVTSIRLVLLFFLVALIAWECLEFLLFVLLSLSCRHGGKRSALLVIRMNRSIDGKRRGEGRG